MGAALAAAVLAAGAAAAADAPLPAEVFATVGAKTLSAQDYRAAYAIAARGKFYHSKPPEAEIAQFQREVGEEIVARVLVVEEAKRRGIAPDPAFVKAELERFASRNRHAASGTPQERERMRAAMAEQFENQSRHDQLERRIRDVPAPGEKAVRDYYDKHREQFVEPEQIRLSVILLRVDPGAPKAAWDGARAEAAALRKRLAGGADFAELARLHSADASAAAGGDMGYLHKGMLPQGIAAVTDALKPGQTSDPVTVLEGVSILRVVDRRAERPRRYEDVRVRATELAQRAESAARWRGFVADLRRATPVRINEALYLPLASAAPAGR